MNYITNWTKRVNRRIYALDLQQKSSAIDLINYNNKYQPINNRGLK